MKQEDATVYLVCETKGTTDLTQLRGDEALKLWCRDRYFVALGVDYRWVSSGTEV